MYYENLAGRHTNTHTYMLTHPGQCAYTLAGKLSTAEQSKLFRHLEIQYKVS